MCLGGDTAVLPPNVGLAYATIHHVSYIAGMVAARQSDEATLGYVGSMYVADSLSCINAFALGMRSVNASKKLYVQHVGSWFDPRSERIAALRMFENYGVNIIGYDSDSTEVVKVAKEEGKLSIAMKSDGTALHGETNLISVLFLWNDVFVSFVNDSQRDMASWTARQYQDKFVGFDRAAVSYGTLSSKIPASTRLAIKDQVERFKSGEAVFCGTFESYCPADGTSCDPSKTIRAPAPGESCLATDDVLSMDWMLKDIVVDLGLLKVPSECQPGTRLNALAAEVCVPCDVGEFSTAVDAFECKKCEPGYFAAELGSRRCVACTVGTFAGEAGSSTCTLCALGFTSSGAATQCQACQVGKYGAADRSCQQCPAGTSANVTGATECRPCGAGYYSDTGAETCSPCLPGYFRKEEGGIGPGSCSACKRGTFTDQGGSTACGACPAGLTTENIASDSRTACVCAEGSLMPRNGSMEAADCKPCPEGLFCPLGSQERFLFEEDDGEGHAPVLVSGYYSPTEAVSIFKCRPDPRRCPGGKLGDCTVGRTGLQCALCMDGWTATASGECEVCTSTNYLPIVAAMIGALVTLVLAYRWGAAEGKVKQTHSTALVALCGSQFISVVQTLGAFSLMSIPWPEPLKSLLLAMQLLNFNVEVLAVECWVRQSPITLYVLQIMVVFALLSAMIGIHCINVIVFHHGKWSMRKPALINSVGIVVMVFFISIVTTILAPLHCSEQHPNGRSTVGRYPTVVCWEGGEHTSMIIVAVLVSLLPTCFIIAAVWAIRSYPRQMSLGDTDFLSSWSFLLFRFRTGAHWYALVYLARSTLIALVPVIPSTVAQLVSLCCILLAAFIITIRIQPWRVWLANVLDIGIMAALLLIVNMAGFFVGEVDTESIAGICVAIVSCICVVVAVVVSYGVWQRISNVWFRRKPYGRFICHHKLGAGSFARLLKIILSGSMGQSKVFIDSDDLTDLDTLFSTVATKTEMIIALCTAQFVRRPWCIGEATTARLNGVPVVRVIFPEFDEPDEEFVQTYHDHVPDAYILTESGMSEEDVRETLRWLSNQKATLLPRVLGMGTIDGLKTFVLFPDRFEDDHCIFMGAEQTDMRDKTSLVIFDHLNSEAAATSFILVLLLRPFFLDSPNNVPHILEPERAVPRSTLVALIICTKDVFTQPHFLRSVAAVGFVGSRYIPLLADREFKIPTNSFFAAQSDHFERTVGNAGQMMQLIVDIFKEIAVEFQPAFGSSTDQVLRTKANELASRLARADTLKKLRLKRDASFDIVVRKASTNSSARHRRHHIRAHLEQSNEVYEVGGDDYTCDVEDYPLQVSARDERVGGTPRKQGAPLALDTRDSDSNEAEEDEWEAPEEPEVVMEFGGRTPGRPSRLRSVPKVTNFERHFNEEMLGDAVEEAEFDSA